VGPPRGAGRYRTVLEPTLAVSRARVGQGRGHGAQARGESVRGHLECVVGTERTDVANREHSWLGVDRRGRRSVKGVRM
jgi:hypothetical protein